MRRTLVILEVADDDDAREWWEALGLPPPWRVNERPDFQNCFVTEITAKQIA